MEVEPGMIQQPLAHDFGFFSASVMLTSNAGRPILSPINPPALAKCIAES